MELSVFLENIKYSTNFLPSLSKYIIAKTFSFPSHGINETFNLLSCEQLELYGVSREDFPAAIGNWCVEPPRVGGIFERKFVAR